jgi:putative ABC transport system permease protein
MPLEALRPSVDAAAYRRTIGAGAITGIVLVGLALVTLFSGSMALIGLGAVLFMVGLSLPAPAPVRPLSLALIIALGVMTVSVSKGFLGVMKRTLGSDYLLLPPAIGLWQNNVGAEGDLAGTLRAIDGVDTVSTFRHASAVMDVAPIVSKGNSADDVNMVSILGIDPVDFPRVSMLSFSAGREDTAFRDLARGRGVILNPIVATQTGLTVGDSLLSWTQRSRRRSSRGKTWRRTSIRPTTCSCSST